MNGKINQNRNSLFLYPIHLAGKHIDTSTKFRLSFFKFMHLKESILLQYKCIFRLNAA